MPTHRFWRGTEKVDTIRKTILQRAGDYHALLASLPQPSAPDETSSNEFSDSSNRSALPPKTGLYATLG